MRTVKVTLTRSTGIEEQLTFETEVSKESDVDRQLQPLYAAIDARCGYRNRRLMEFQEYVRHLPAEARTSIDLAYQILYGEKSLKDAIQANENHYTNHPQDRPRMVAPLGSHETPEEDQVGADPLWLTPREVK